MVDIAIIGGGAGGLACVVSAIRAAQSRGVRVPSILVLESADKIGRSILRSGNGRCNFSNMHNAPEAYNVPELVPPFLSVGVGAEAENPVLAFFEELGLVWREEEGRLYPLANKASVVLDVLRAPLRDACVTVRCEANVASIAVPQSPGESFTLKLADGELVRAGKVVLAAGGQAGSFGLEELVPWEEPVSVLGPLATDATFTKPLDNVRVRCTIRLLRNGQEIAAERGEVLFRKYGVSGIAVFNLSRFAQAGDELSIDFWPDAPARAFCNRVETLGACGASTLTLERFMQGIVVPLVGQQILKAAGLEAEAPATPECIAALEKQVHDFRLTVQGIGDTSLCQVHRGGFALESFSPDTLEAWDIPGLYVVGEALNVDGACGGYNLHWAFVTGMKAGRHAASG